MANHRLMFLRARLAIPMLALVGCGSVASKPPGDAAPPACDPMAPFGPPQPLMLDGAGSFADPAPSADELTLYVSRRLSSGAQADIYMESRNKIDEPFNTPVTLAAVNSPEDDLVPTLAAAGMALVFASDRVAMEGFHLYVATRTTPLADFGMPALLAGVNSQDVTKNDEQAFLTADGTELWFISDRDGNTQIYRAPMQGSGFANPALVPELNSTASESHVMLSTDHKTVYFGSTRTAPGALGGFDIFRAHRDSVSDGFGLPAVVSELNTAMNEYPRWLSADNCRIYFHRELATGFFGIFVATRPAK